MNGNTNPRIPAERAAISRGQRHAWQQRRKEVSDLNAEVARLVAVAEEAARVLAEAERKLMALDRENRKLKRALNLRTKREEIHEELRRVDAEHRAEIAGAATRPHILQKIHARRRMLEEKLARLNGRGTK